MTILESLDRYYQCLLDQGQADPPGISREPISFCIWLDVSGQVKEVEDLRDRSGHKPVIRRLGVPRAVIRTSGISSNFFWDKTSYALGVTIHASSRTAAEHAAFKALHVSWLKTHGDQEQKPFLSFLTRWSPATFYTDPRFSSDMLDKNIIFGVSGEQRRFLHEQSAVQAFITSREDIQWKIGRCLITGETTAIARLHPPIKGVDGAQTSGARLVSFGSDAFTSYGANNGANAPISETVTHRYGAALNHLLDRANHHHKKIGDSTLVYWAEANRPDEAAAAKAERDFGAVIEPQADDQGASIGRILSEMERGRAVGPAGNELTPAMRFHVLCLNPNAGRLSVRYWLTSDMRKLSTALRRHIDDIAIEPPPWTGQLPSIRYLLVENDGIDGKSGKYTGGTDERGDARGT